MSATDLQVTFGRDGADLVVPNYLAVTSAGFWVPENGITWPSFPMRRTYAPESEAIGGRTLKAAVPDQGQTSLRIYARAATTTALVVLMDELEAATSQFQYDFTLGLFGFSRTWRADSELPQWGEIDSGEARSKIIAGTITIPLNPASA